MEPIELLQQAVTVFEELGLRYLVTDSMASMAYGEARFTNDIDIVVDLDAENVEQFLAKFPPSEFYVSAAAVRDAVLRRRQFNVIHPASGLKIDVMLPTRSEFDRNRLSRGRSLPVIDSGTVWFAAPEDVILKKLQYYRDGGSQKHVRDILGMLRVSGAAIDRDDIARWSEKLNLQKVWEEIVASE